VNRVLQLNSPIAYSFLFAMMRDTRLKKKLSKSD